MPRTNKILIRSGTAAPSASDFATNEPAWDRTAKKLYVKAGDGTMVEIGSGGGTAYVLEYATTANFPTTGQSTARIYVATDTGRIYRWTGTEYQELGAVSAYDSRWDLFIPAAPTNLAGTAGNQQVALTWTAPTVSAQTPITDYLVQYSSNSGSTWTTFADGTSSTASATVTGLTNGTAYVFRVAAVNAVGTSSYTAASSAITPAITDPYFSSVTLLLHADGTNGSTTFTDSSSAARTVTAVGNAAISTTQSKFGGASGYFDGTGDYLNTGASATTLIGQSTDFTVEMWLYPTSLSGNIALFSTRANSTGNDVIIFGIRNSSLYIDTNAAGVCAGSTTLTANTWQHVAMVRSGNTFSVYLGGSSIASGTSSLTFSNSQSAYIGGEARNDGGSAIQYTGYMDDIRVTKVARTITVPTAAFPNS